MIYAASSISLWPIRATVALNFVYTRSNNRARSKFSLERERKIYILLEFLLPFPLTRCFDPKLD